MSGVPLKPEFGVSCFWRLLIFTGWPRRTPFGGAENPPITFICELKKQVRRSFVLLGEGQSAISDRADAAHGISNPNATEQGFKYGKKVQVRLPDRLSAGDRTARLFSEAGRVDVPCPVHRMSTTPNIGNSEPKKLASWPSG